ncbi:hypothetical protein [Streptomyces sp. A012304]|uniref:hypothetical protein n=1 Tax=Streptomyces sp. A012304 TaxID=375446 RepID=UPI00222EC37B|nr:hypothetical protein [Streptomyces sp. A012304]GKQ37932.1 hypothetical protein ALMP_44670 [Streptomyces sp. A012304]
MPLVLVAGAVLQCSHGGQTKLTTGDPRVTVQGQGVVSSGMEAGFQFGAAEKPVPGMITPCTGRSPDGSTPVPCLIAAPAPPAGLTAKLTVGGRPVLLATASGTTVSGVPGTWKVSDPGQTVLEASP